MANLKRQKQGEILLLLSNRSKKKKEDIAKGLDIHPAHLSKLFKSELLTSKIKRKAAEYFAVDESIFEAQDNLPVIPGFDFLANEPEVEYSKESFGDMSAADVLRYLEEKDRRHFEERGRLLAIIENLTKKWTYEITGNRFGGAVSDRRRDGAGEMGVLRGA